MTNFEMDVEINLVPLKDFLKENLWGCEASIGLFHGEKRFFKCDDVCEDDEIVTVLGTDGDPLYDSDIKTGYTLSEITDDMYIINYRIMCGEMRYFHFPKSYDEDFIWQLALEKLALKSK